MDAGQRELQMTPDGSNHVFKQSHCEGTPSEASSNPVTVPITVTFVNQAPVATGDAVSLDENDAPKEITLAADDVDNEQNQLVGLLVTLPDASLGVLQDGAGNVLSAGQPLSSRTIYPSKN